MGILLPGAARLSRVPGTLGCGTGHGGRRKLPLRDRASAVHRRAHSGRDDPRREDRLRELHGRADGDRAGPPSRARARGAAGRGDHGRGRVASATGAVGGVLPRRPRAPVRRDDPGRRAPDHALCAVLPVGRGPDGAVLHLSPPVPGRDARDRAVGQHPASAGVLGADVAVVLPAHRLLEAPARRPAGGADGACRDRGGRARHDRGDADPGEHRGELQPDRHPARGRGDPGLGMVSPGADPDSPRRLHEVGAVPVPLLAPACDGRADAGLGLSPFGHDGEGGRVPDGADVAGARRAS